MSSRLTVFTMSLALGISTLSGCSTVGSLFDKDDKQADTTRGIPKKSATEYFDSAQAHLAKERYDLAEKDLMDLRTFYPVGGNTHQAQLDLIFIKYKKGEFEQAVLAADRFIKLYPNHADIDYAYYVKGVSMMNSGFGGVMKYTQLDPAHRDTGYLRSAFDVFKSLVSQFPESKYTPDATERMHHMYNQFAESEMSAARFNLRRGAYVGAAERARWVLQYYPQSVQTPEAIATLAHSYNKLGLTDQANKYKSLLKANYPDLIDGDTIRIKAARTRGSLSNRLTLGLFGTPSRTIGETYVQNNPPKGLQPVQSANASSYTTPRRPSAGLAIGLGLPPTTSE